VDCEDSEEIEKSKITFNLALEMLNQPPLKHFCKPHSATKGCGEVECSYMPEQIPWNYRSIPVLLDNWPFDQGGVCVHDLNEPQSWAYGSYWFCLFHPPKSSVYCDKMWNELQGHVGDDCMWFIKEAAHAPSLLTVQEKKILFCS